MRLTRALRRIRRTGASPAAPLAVEARAKRARDHLARKRKHELRRRQRERTRAERAVSRARVRSVLAPLFFALAFAGGLSFSAPISEMLLYRDSPLEHFVVQGASTLTPDDIAKELGIEEGRTLDTLETQELREAIHDEPWIESIRSLRLPGGTLIVSVVERKAVARWLANEFAESALIDDHGRRFSTRTEPGGPLPLVLGSLDDGATLPASAIEILEELRRHMILTSDPTQLTLHLPERIGAGKAADDADRPGEVQSGYVLQIGERGPRALLGKNFLQQRVARLAALLESEASQRSGAQLIDLRYADRAILRTEPASG